MTAKKTCLMKLKKEMTAFCREPPPHLPAVSTNIFHEGGEISVNESNILEWHFLLEGPPSSPYEGGWYIGKLRFPSDYPFKPPAIMMMTPSGRFKTGTRLCLSISDFHPELWNPMWSVASVLTGLLSFMLDETPTTGSLESTVEEKKAIAAESAQKILNSHYRTLFPQLPDLIQAQAAKQEGEAATEAEACGRDSAELDGGAVSKDTSIAGEDMRPTEDCPSSAQAPLSEPEPLGEGEESPNSLQQETCSEADAAGRPEERAMTEEDPRHLIRQGQALTRCGRLEEAVKRYETALHLQPPASSQEEEDGNQPSTIQILSYLSAARTAVRHSGRGHEWLRKKKVDAALKAFDASLTAVGGCPTLHTNRALALAAAQRHEEAVAACDHALELYPQHMAAKKQREESLTAISSLAI